MNYETPAVRRRKTFNWKLGNIHKNHQTTKQNQTFPIKNRLKLFYTLWVFFYHEFSTKFFHGKFSHISSQVLKLPLLLFIDKVFPHQHFQYQILLKNLSLLFSFFTWKINHKIWFHEKKEQKKSENTLTHNNFKIT